MTKPAPAAAASPNRRSVVLPGLVFGAILLLLALRLTMTETLDSAFTQQLSLFKARAAPIGGVAAPEIGPAVTTGLAALMLLLAAGAAGCAARARSLTRTDIGLFLIIVGILSFGVASTLAASNRFIAAVGLSDLATALLAGWAVRILCHRALLGIPARRTLAAMLIAVLAIWTVRGLYQRFVDIPDTIDYYNNHREEALASQNMKPDDPGVKLYESRMLSKEVTGYVTLSNVMGAGMAGLLAILAGTIAAGRFKPATAEAPAVAPSPRSSREGTEIQLATLAIPAAVALLLAGTVVLFLTESRGASVLGVGCVLLLFAGTYIWQHVVRHRTVVVIAAILLIAVGAAAVVGYGITRDRLPGKSLTFRWHYWTASVALIRQSPLLGIGLNNFGDYYPTVKRASSPEDVKDPHSFFVRFAAELGLPTAILVGLLILWMSLRATRLSTIDDPVPVRSPVAILPALLFCVLWWIIHQFLAESQQSFFVILSVLSAGITWGTWLLGDWLIGDLDARGKRYLLIAALLGALAMLLYDQINMALVTGPVAMLFWMLLGAASSADDDAAPTPRHPAPAFAAATLCSASGVFLALWLWWPTLQGTHPWDSSSPVFAYLNAMSTDHPDFPALKTLLLEAIARNPRSISLRRQLMLVKEKLGEPVTDDVHALLALDRTSPRLRLSLASEPSDLPAGERIELLHQAVQFDDQLPADEVMRLTPTEHAQIDAALRELQGKQ